MQITVKSEPSHVVIAENPIPDQGLMTYFGLDANTSKEELGKLNEIKEYLKEFSEDEFKQYEELRNIKFRLGSPNIGSSQVEHIHKYIKLRKAMQEAQARVEEMER